MIKQFKLEFDRDYGSSNLTGWSVVVNGTFLSMLEPWLIVALWKAFRKLI